MGKIFGCDDICIVLQHKAWMEDLFYITFYPAHTPVSQIFGFYVCFGSRLEQLPGRAPPHLTHTLLHTLQHLLCANVATQSYLNFLIIRRITDPREL